MSSASRYLGAGLLFLLLPFLAVDARGQGAAASYIVADPVADVVMNGQVVARAGMGQVVSIRQLANNGTLGLVTVGGRSGWISSRHLVPARPISIAYFQGTARFNQGEQAKQQRNKQTAVTHYAAGIPLLKRAVDLARKENNARYLASAATNLGRCYDETGQLAAAEPHYLTAYRTNETLLGRGHAQLAAIASHLGFFYQRWQRPQEALTWHQKALANCEARLGAGHIETAKARLEVGTLVYLHLHRWQEGEALLSQAHAALLAAAGPNDRQTIQAAQMLAQVFTSLGKLREAETLYRQVLTAREATLGPEDINIAGTCQLLAGVCLTLGKTDEIEGLLRRCLRIREKNLGVDHPHIVVTLRDLADLATTAGRFAEAEQQLDRALKIAERAGQNSADVANVLEGMGNLRKQQGRYEQAETAYRRAIAILEKTRNSDTAVAHTLRALAMLLFLTERSEDAKPVLERRLRLLESAHGKNALQLVDTLENLATIDRTSGRLTEAEQKQQRALGIVRQHPGSTSFEAAAWNNLGAIFAVQKKHEAAQDAYRRSLELFQQVLQPRNFRLAYVRINLALREQELGRHAEAAQLAREAREVLEQVGGDFDQARGVALDIEADAARATGRMDEALKAADRYRRLMRQRVDKLLLVRSESERLRFMQVSYTAGLHEHLRWAVETPGDSAVVAATAEWVVNGKNLVNELQANVARMSRLTNSEQLDALMAALEVVRCQLAELALRDAVPAGASQQETELARLATEEARLTREIRALGTPENVGGEWISLDAVRRAIPARSCLIETVRLRRADGTRGYATWVIPAAESGGAVAFVDLGSAKAIEAALAAFQREMAESFQRIATDGEAKAEQRMRKTLRQLAQLVLDPLLPHVGSAERCLLSSDAALWLVPWASLPLADGTYLVEKLELRQIASGRELARPPSGTSANAPLIMADPDFDLTPTAARQALAGVRISRSLSGGAPTTTRTITRESLPKVERLPGTAAEARAVIPALEAYSSSKVSLLTGKEALEGAFKAAVRPRVLMLSTHGFFLTSAQAASLVDEAVPDASLVSRGPALSQEHPLLRCGLLLAGCNTRGKSAASTSSAVDDGVLSGLEILGADLEGCELVVLSACETALGKTEAGEGVAGLRQAFQLAGARGVVDTLWPIPDDETVQLMERFFQGVAQKQPPAAALREAQRHIITSRRASGSAAHPVFWGAFGFTGR